MRKVNERPKNINLENTFIKILWKKNEYFFTTFYVFHKIVL